MNRRKLIMSLGTTTAVAVWHKPVVNSILLPAHAQASMCPMIVIGNVVFGPASGSSTPPVCSTTFDVLSADPVIPLDVSAITTDTLPPDTTVDVMDLGTATNVVGPRVTWRGPASDAPFCSDAMPIEDVTFTVTATCDAVPGLDTFSQQFTLSEILAP